MQTSKTALIVFACFLMHPLADLDAQVSEGKRPRIGIALSGGGAKGLAHTGVLKVMEEAGRHFNKT